MTLILTRSTMPNYHDPDTGDTLRSDYTAPFQTIADATTAFRNSRNPNLRRINEPVIRTTFRDSLKLMEMCQTYYLATHDFPSAPAVLGKILCGGWVREHHAFELMDTLGISYEIEDEN